MDRAVHAPALPSSADSVAPGAVNLDDVAPAGRQLAALSFAILDAVARYGADVAPDSWLSDPTYRPDPGAEPGTAGEAIQSVRALWRCESPACSGAPWTGAVIGWPAWAAYHNNARAKDEARAVFAEDGTPLYPYMGAWADGCQVTALSGTVLIIQWKRGGNVWREMELQPGQSHTIHLAGQEDGAMIETDEGVAGFSASLRDCTPRPVPL